MHTKVGNLTKHSILEFIKNAFFILLRSIFLIKSQKKIANSNVCVKKL